MTGIAHDPGPTAPPPIPAQPVAFDGLSGWYGPGTTRRGAVLCGTLGFEQLRAHRAWRELAGALAGAGCATLRFDLPGEGDSADPDAVRLDGLVAAVRRAIRFLREAGAEEIVLVGLRLGGTLAALASCLEPVDRLVVLAPFATGRAYLREVAIQGRTIDRLADGAPIAHPAGATSSGGFAIGAGLALDLAALDIRGAPPARDILVVGPDPAGLAARWAAEGASVAAAPFPHLAQLVSRPSTAGLPPDAFAAVVAFAAAGARPRAGPSPVLPVPAGGVAGPGFAEEPLRFGDGLFGILCRPVGGSPGAATLILVSTGLDAHPGYGRRTTALARELAAAGVASLRMDVRGVGDSAPRADRATPLYAPDAVADVRAALDALAARGAGAVGVVGNCSGAYLAYHALRADPRLAGAAMVNLYCFAWDPEHDAEAALGTMVRSASTYAGLLRRGHVWRRLLRREIRVAAILAGLARAAAARVLSRRLRPRGGDTVARQIAALRRRGAKMLFVYGVGEPGLEALRAELGRGRRLAQRLGRPPAVVPGADHNMTTPGSHAALRGLLLDFAAGLGAGPRP